MGILRDKIAIITGAGYGVGEGIATAFAKEGRQLSPPGERESKLIDACNKLKLLGATAVPMICDVGDPTQIQRVVDQTITTFGAIDILVNNAHTISLGELESIDDAGYARTFDTGPFATFRFMKAVHPHMKARGKGHIINLASTSAVRWDAKGFGVYAASKEAIRALSRAAACEWGADGIRVNTISPLARTPGLDVWIRDEPEASSAFLSTVPLGYVGDSEADIGPVAVFLCSPGAQYLTGLTVPIDGGQAYMG